MKRTLLICFLAIIAISASSQKIYFVYLQTETREPFFVRMNDELYSSSQSGYLILSRLKDSTYSFKIGFPGKNIDLDFKTPINKKDHGYLIKNLGEKGWGLFDLQTLSLQTSLSNSKTSAQFNSNPNVAVSAFTDLLSRATDDPSLKQTPVFAKEEEKKPQAIEAVVKEENKPADVTVKEEKRQEPVNRPEEKKTESPNVSGQKIDESTLKNPSTPTDDIYKQSRVTKISETATSEGFETVFVDQYRDGKKDTVRIVIAAEKEISVKEEQRSEPQKDEKKLSNAVVDSSQIKADQEVKKEGWKKLWPFNKSKATETTKAPDKNKTTETVKPPGNKATQAAKEPDKNKTTPTDKAAADTKKEEGKKWWQFGKKDQATEAKKCAVLANNDDFLKLRRKMAARTNDAGMLEEARKYFREKCFNTEQIRNLSSMFLSSAGKYNFFEIAHEYASDVENFPSLQSELRDENYINRFKDLVGTK